ncbi:MAG: DUF4421 domain-containing protein [Bacteroides sp.]|nr:DUF4421 domain-containing protein [Bacteroides sp.]
MQYATRALRYLTTVAMTVALSYLPAYASEETDSLRSVVLVNPEPISSAERMAGLAEDLYMLSEVSEAEANLDRYDPDRNWLHLLKKGKLKMDDPTVEWPAFLGFCVKLYNWGDKTFNSYDPDYVVGTGKRWKARITSENWVDTHTFDFRRKLSMRFMSNITSNLSGYLQYMAVSVGYTLDMTNIIGNEPSNHKKVGFGFTCARFSAELYYQENTGGSYIRRFDQYKKFRIIKEPFPGLSFNTWGIEAYYFFNNRRYSQGAAYNYSKIQKRSAGSPILGFAFTSVSNKLDFNTLPDNLKPYYNLGSDTYNFHYKNYCLAGGYGYNFVVGKHSLFNLTAMPRIGVARGYEDSFNSGGYLLSLGINGKGSYTLNLGDYFLCLSGSIDGNWYNSGDYSLFSSIENVSLSLGVRF